VPERAHLGLVLLSGCFDRVHYGLAMASSAAALERKATLLATQGALGALLAEAADGRPGWAHLPLSPELVAPGIADGGALDAQNRARGVAGFEELLQACASLGVEIIACEMGLRARGLAAAALRSDLPIRRAGLATLLARQGQLVVI
jgi:peroxiredoxin family protein